jgi:putative aminophosphonate oxidoreductase
MTFRSYWLEEVLAEDTDVARPLEGEHKADVCIVGGGYTGLWTAIRLKEREPSLDVVIVERDICGGGASGRNSGFALTWWTKYLSLVKVCGEEEALRLCRASAQALDEISGFCEQNGIDAQYRRNGWLWAATCAPHKGVWNATVEALERHQIHPFRELTQDEAQAMSGSSKIVGGVFEASAATIQPARLARGLRRAAIERGVRVYENTPMVRLRRSTPPIVQTREGAVKAECVVLAMNAWSARFREIFPAIVVISADMIMTEPIPERLAEIGWTNGAPIMDSRMLLQAYRTTLDGRIGYAKGGINGVKAFGGRIGDRFDGQTPLAADLERGLKEVYPTLSKARVVSGWNGPVDRSKSGLPMFGGLGGRRDILYAVGFSGNGVGPCVLAGRILASLVLDAKDEWSGAGLVRPPERSFPPEPIRYIGTSLVRAAASAKDRAEHEGRTPGAITRLLAGFAPASIAPTKRKQPDSLARPEGSK